MNEGGGTGHANEGTSFRWEQVFFFFIANLNVLCRLNSLLAWLGLMDPLDAQEKVEACGNHSAGHCQPHKGGENALSHSNTCRNVMEPSQRSFVPHHSTETSPWQQRLYWMTAESLEQVISTGIIGAGV